MMRTVLLLINVIGLSLAGDVTHYTPWGPCSPIPGELDQTCEGRHFRTGFTFVFIFLKRIFTESGICLFTHDKIRGGYTAWSAWDDCSNKCDQTTNKYRTCNNPTPCNGGNDCTDLGSNVQTKNCGPVNGQWGDWGSWESCVKDTTLSLYGTGETIRFRECDNPPAICGGDDCVASNNETGNCRVVPPCLTTKIFDEKFLKKDSAMVIYSSAQVDIYTLTKNKCTMATIIYNYWELYKVNEISEEEEQIGGRSYTLKFKVSPGVFELGLYRLYVKIGYPQTYYHWMEESMYFRIVHPPPHALIKGGAGRTVGQGIVNFDARSVSYSLTKKPGDPTGLTFRWKCLNFVTSSIYNLLAFNIGADKVFNDEIADNQKWYHIGFTSQIDELVAWVNSSMLYKRVRIYRTLNVSCSNAGGLYVKVNMTNMNTTQISPDILNDNVMQLTPTTDATTTSADDAILYLPLTSFYGITYLADMFDSPLTYMNSDHVMPLPDYNLLVQNEINDFLDFLYDSSSALISNAETFYKKLSESSLTLQSLVQLRELSGLPSSANKMFFDNLEKWINIANETQIFAKALVSMLNNFEPYKTDLNIGFDLVSFVGIDGVLQINIDQLESCLLKTFGDIMEGFFNINKQDWHDMKNKEIFYLNWLKNELITSTQCERFNGEIDGSAAMNVTEEDVNNGTGFLIYIRVEFEESISYFIQHAQSILGEPPELEIECRLNCMKKSALSSILSLKAGCPSCTFDQLRGAKFSWNVKDYDIYTRKSYNNLYWREWMLSDPNTREFVMRAGVMNASTGYLIESYMETSTGQMGLGIWTVYTNILPYNGTCVITDAIWDEKKVTTAGWKDEGFRSNNDVSLDWKEQLNYRIVQLSQAGDAMLYYGSDQDNYITLKPGQEVDRYHVVIKVQIFDIFIDYTECFVNLGYIFPNYKTEDTASVSKFIDTSGDSINYYMKSGDIKQVTMNAEVAGTPVTELVSEVAGSPVTDLTIPQTIFDTKPDEWINLGAATENDTVITQTFDELWNMYQLPDRGVVIENNIIIQKLSSFVGTLDEVSNTVDGTSTTKIVQIANSIGTVISNKDFVDKSSASNANKGITELVQKLLSLAEDETYPKYEDYITVCQGILRVLNNVLEGILPKTSIETPNEIDLYSMEEFLSSRRHFGNESKEENNDLTSMERAFIASRIAEQNKLEAEIRNDKVKIEVPILLAAIANLGHVMRMLNHRKQMLVNVQNSHINSTEDAKLIPELVEHGFHLDDVNIDFRESHSKSTKEQNIQVTLYDHTPFSWDKESQFISSKTVTITVGDDNEINTVIPSQLKLKNAGQTMTRKSVQLSIPTDETEQTSQMLMYKMFWKNPFDNMVVSVFNAVDHLNHIVYLRKDKEPTAEEYDWQKTVRSSDWVSTNEIKFFVSGGLYQRSSLVYVGILVSSPESSDLSTELNTTLNITGPSNTRIVEYRIISATVGCRVWDDLIQQWDKSHCEVDSSSTITETICVCTDPPGNSFATTFYVPPNTIDFSTVFSKFNLTDNAAVFSTVICLVVVYLLICVWALRQDKKDIDRWAVSYLVDNAPFNTYLYMLTVYTGLSRQAGTTSNVRLMVIDINGEADIRRLEDDKKQGFSIGSVRRFIMSTAVKINNPTAIKIWHDNSGSGNDASWYLNKIVMEDIQTDEKYFFICEKWLSLDEDDGSLDCVIPVSKPSDITTFSYLFSDHSRHSLTDSHLWLSVAIRPEESNFTRAQRLSCCLTLLFLTMISSAMFYGQDTGSKIMIGPLSVSLTGIYISMISALVAAPPVVLVTYLFRHSRRRKPVDVKDSGIIVVPTGLPYWCRFVAWGIVTVAILVSGFFLILYSMEWGKVKSEGWLVSFVLSFMESICIVDPFKILLISILFALIVKDKDDNHIKYDTVKLVAETKQHASSTWGSLKDIRQPDCSPIKENKMKRMKKRRREILRARKSFIELALFLTFLTVLYLVSFSNRDPHWFFATNHIEQHLISFPHEIAAKTTQSFSKVSSAATFYDWLNDTVIPFVFPRVSYINVPLAVNQRLYVKDQDNFRVGPLRVRQVRALEGECQTTFLSNIACYNKYSILDEEDDDYCVGWKEGPCDRGEAVYSLSSLAWKFVSPLKVWGLPTTGIHSTYGGGGYVAEMAINYNISKLILNDLYRYMWIDRSTRAVFTEFTLYNVGANVFIYVSLLCEFSNIGGVFTSTSIKPFRPYQHVGSYGFVVFVSELIVLIAILISLAFKLVGFYKHGLKALKGLWNVLEITIIVLFLVCTAMYIVRWRMINKAMDKFKENKNMFVNFSHIAVWDEIFNILLATVIFLTTLRLLKILSYSKRINRLGYVLSEVSRDLFGCFIIFLIIYSAFVLFGYLIFGRELDTYKDVFSSAVTLTSAVIGKNSIIDLFTVQPIIGRIYYFWFVFFLLWISMTMINATLNVGITSVKERLIRMPPVYGITNILAGMWKNTFGLSVIFSSNKTKLLGKKTKD